MILFNRKQKSTLSAPKPIQGTIYHLFQDMSNQPHLLIAGSTGSGKSVVINGIMNTLLFRTPDDVPGGARFILIDPKRVELSAYKNAPHTVLYASEPDTMIKALSAAMDITERRYARMQQEGTKKYKGADLYIVIDEFADLMTTNRKGTMPTVQRLAQIGRAARVHLIIATQTPIAKVLPTEIKCNFDARVGLRTRSAQDSRNILGYSGLEDLPRYGECIYMKPEGDEHYQVPYVPEEETDKLIQYWIPYNEYLKQQNKRRRWI